MNLTSGRVVGNGDHVAGLALAVGDGWWNVQHFFDFWSKAFNSNVLKDKDKNDVTVTHDMTDMIHDRNNDRKIMTNNGSDTTSGDIMRCGYWCWQEVSKCISKSTTS